MIDIEKLCQNPEIYRQNQINRGLDAKYVDIAIEKDKERKKAVQDFEKIRHLQKTLGKEVASADKKKKQELLVKIKDIAEKTKILEANSKKATEAFRASLYKLANLAEAEAPKGGEDDFKIIESKGEIPFFDFKIKDHVELGVNLGILDLKRGAKVSGSRFYFLKGKGALLEMALINLAIAKGVKIGFEPLITPTIVNSDIMQGTGFLDAHADEIYYLQKDDQYLVGTSEVALAGFHKDEILEFDDVPKYNTASLSSQGDGDFEDACDAKKYIGISACYRREAGSAGKDVRGILRVHQFNKVEMFIYCKNESAKQYHKKLLEMQKSMLDILEIPYRVIDIATGDLGSSAARKFDIEGWIPSQNRYRELTSTSNCTEFQSRRLNIRYRNKDKNRFASTLNGTLATTRWLVAFLENHQRQDGTIEIPKGFQKYFAYSLLD